MDVTYEHKEELSKLVVEVEKHIRLTEKTISKCIDASSDTMAGRKLQHMLQDFGG